MPLRYDEIDHVKAIVKEASVDAFDSKPLENKIKGLEKLVKELESDVKDLKKDKKTNK